MKQFVLDRCEQIILEVMDLLSSSIYQLPIDRTDFKVGAWTPLNINHENVVVKYIALACTKAPKDAVCCFIRSYSVEVMSELGEAYDEFYANEPVAAHNLAISVGRELTRFKTFLEVLVQMGEMVEAEALALWLATNPVDTGENDWR
jgi:hypothetical protein